MRKLHEWDLSYAKARQLQVRLAGRGHLWPPAKEPGLIAGLDCAFSRDGKRVIAAVIVLRVTGSRSRACSEFKSVETAPAKGEIRSSYIPEQLSFREAPARLAAIEKLATKPDVFLVDGQGLDQSVFAKMKFCPVASTWTVSPSMNLPARSSPASGFSIRCWIVRLSGRAPYDGS